MQNIYNESIGFKSGSFRNSSLKNEPIFGSTNSNFSSSEYLENMHTRPSLSSNSRPELKSLVFKLKNYFSVDAFSEEFIAYEGIRVLINLIDTTSGNTRVYFKSNFFCFFRKI